MTKFVHRLVFALFLVAALFLGVRTAHSNISADDAGFMYGIANGNLRSWIDSLISYVPGRNLHILWQAIIFSITGTEMDTFWLYHALESLSYAMVFFLLFKVLVKMHVNSKVSFLISVGAMFFPVFSSTLLWANSLPQHIFSTLFLLMGILIIIRESDGPEELSVWESTVALVWFALAAFTYDQPAAVVLLLSLVSVALHLAPSFFQFLPLRKSRFLTLGLLGITCSYIFVFFHGRGTGNNLSVGSGTFERLTGNILLPVKAYLKIRGGFFGAYAAFNINPLIAIFMNVLVAMVFVSLIFVVYRRRHSVHGKILGDFGGYGVLFLLFSGAAYFPASIWYVAPRHLFLPVVLGFIFIGLLISEIDREFQLARFIKFTNYSLACILVVSLFVGFNSQISAWLTRDIHRQHFYQSLEDVLQPLGNPCIAVGQELNNSDTYLYSENLNYAAAFYSGKSVAWKSRCNFPPVESPVNQYKCEIENREIWYQLKGYLREDGANGFKDFSLIKICG